MRNATSRWGAMLLAAAVLLPTRLTAGMAENWPEWRGPHDFGSTEGGTYPVKWDAERALWKAPLPGKGCSTPIVFAKHIYVTAPIDGRDAMLAFDWEGKPAWQKKFGPEKEGKHRNGSGSNPSPATDGKAVFVYFKSGTFAALELDGKIRWQTNLVQAFGPDTLYWDHGTSPILTVNNVIMTRLHHGQSWLAAFDKGTGAMRWKMARNYETAVEGDHSYATPVVLNHGGREEILVWGGEHLTLHDAADGKCLWTSGGFNAEGKPNWPTVASPVTVGDIAIIAFGRADRGQPRLYGVSLGSKGDPASGGKRLWSRDDVGTFVPTPAVYKGHVYIVRDRGEVECLDPATGKTLWNAAFPKASSNFYASPVIAGGKLYGIREDGAVFVANIEDHFELLAENNMGEHVIASPVPVANRLLVRGEQHLFCLAAE